MSEQAPSLAPGISEGGTPGPSHASAQQPTQNAIAMSPVVMATSTIKIPTKRRCPDFDKDPLSDDDRTSTYTVHGTVAPSEGGSHDHMQDVDLDDYENPFTEVRYKKNRPAGIPVVFKTVNSEKSFWRINPNVVANEVIGIAKEKLLSHRINKDGSLAVSVESLLAANRLLAVTSLCTIEVTTSVPESYSRNLGKIKGVPLEYSDAPHHAHSLPSLINPPWTIPPLEIQTEIPGLGSKSSVAPLVAKTMSLSHLEARYKDDIHIYTDGSTSNKGSTSAYSIPMLDTFKCFRLSHHTCSTSAELHAILSASSFIEAFGTPSNWVILTDSKASLELLQGMHLRTSQATIIYRVQLTLAQARLHGHNVRLQWIPSHCQIAGNEEADHLAAQAHDGDAMEATSFTPGDAKFILRHLRHLRCRKCWLKDTSAETLLPYIDPDFELPPHTGMKTKYDALIHRLRLEVAFTNSFLFRIKRRDSPRCDCGEPYQDVQHILLDCERFQHERRRMEIRLQILDDRPLSLTKLLGPWPTRKKQDRAMNIIHDFLKDTRIVYDY
ncbi:uncharacterized protein LOC121837166 [Ixodes scapularis]|uniref:uncharacterized protein LOC121837166 n=1 Tax=Ixodes scapularis TaxID=6945 RepID=UPI001C38AA6F|nr:uncharacterized protein LOC121837166 [Ixodes scapularis]